MSSIHQQQGKPQMLPAVQNTGQEQRGCSNEPQNASDVEAQMAQQARQTIRARLKMANITSLIQEIISQRNSRANDTPGPSALSPSTVAVKHGLSVSMLERLMNNINLYNVTLELSKYLHPPALSKLVYNGELQPYAHKATCDSYCEWKHLPKKGFPLIFHGVAGTDERDSSSPSVYNMAEVEVLKESLKALIDGLHKRAVTKIGPREIGIIAPYRKQVEKNKNALQTDTDLMKEDLENVLRFNVAMSRARALLIVVGDPRLLNTNQIWNKFIQYCCKEGGYRGITVSDT